MITRRTAIFMAFIYAITLAAISFSSAQELPPLLWERSVAQDTIPDDYDGDAIARPTFHDVRALAGGQVLVTGTRYATLGAHAWQDDTYLWELSPSGDTHYFDLFENGESQSLVGCRLATGRYLTVGGSHSSYYASYYHRVHRFDFDSPDLTPTWSVYSHTSSTYDSGPEILAAELLSRPEAGPEMIIGWSAPTYDTMNTLVKWIVPDGEFLREMTVENVHSAAMLIESDGSFALYGRELYDGNLRRFLYSAGGQPVSSRILLDSYCSYVAALGQDDGGYMLAVRTSANPDAIGVLRFSAHDALLDSIWVPDINPDASVSPVTVAALSDGTVVLLTEEREWQGWYADRFFFLRLISADLNEVLDSELIAGEEHQLYSMAVNEADQIIVAGKRVQFDVQEGVVYCYGHPVSVNERLIDPLPISTVLSPTYPNPFNAATSFNVNLHAPGILVVMVYDLLGRPVSVLHDGPTTQGQHAFTFDATGLPSGTYLLRAETDDEMQVRRMMFLK